MFDNSLNDSGTESDVSRRDRADELPFIVRSSWLRDYVESEGLVWAADLGITSPLWSLHSDPLCDIGSTDQNI